MHYQRDKDFSICDSSSLKVFRHCKLRCDNCQILKVASITSNAALQTYNEICDIESSWRSVGSKTPFSSMYHRAPSFPLMSLVSWQDPIPFHFCIFSISALTLTYYDARNRRNASRELRESAQSRALNAQFLLSLYCSRRLYSVTSRRGSNDQWLSRSLKQAGQTLIVPSTTHVSVVLPFEGESSTAPLTIFLACILYFCHLFPSSISTVSRHLRRDLGRARPIIGFIVPLGTQVRRLVIFKLLRPVSFLFLNV